MLPRVFVVQNHLRYDRNRGDLVPKYDISPAEKFGEFKFVLPPRATLENIPEVLGLMERSLSDYSDKDSLLLIGNPVFIGWAVAIAAKHNGGRVRCLYWSGGTQSYEVAAATIPGVGVIHA
jgi:hypothetical protein